jgi:hypothetical protein
VFSELVSHYLFADRFGRPGKGKGKGKGPVGYCRRNFRNFMVRLPRFSSFDDLNQGLEEQCRRPMKDRLRGHVETIGKRLACDRAPFQAELLFETFSQRYERGSSFVTSNLPFDEWTSVFGAERLTGALLDRLTHHVHILELNGESYRLRQSGNATPPPNNDEPD